jgi:hypothetical protein
MELFLNLCWLMLAVPAYWLWRSESPGWSTKRLHCSRSLVLLGSVLLLLFPVVSATDDLHAMHPEMEEASPCKRVVRSASTDKASCSSSRLGNAPSSVLSVFSFHRGPESEGLLRAQSTVVREQVRLGTNACRAPPVSRLG